MKPFNRIAVIIAFLYAMLVPMSASAFWTSYNPTVKHYLEEGAKNCRLPIQLVNPIVTASQSVKEGGTVTFTIKKPRQTYSAVRYRYNTKNGTAGAQDYETKHGMLTFNPFETSKTVQVRTLRDHLREESEVFSLLLHSPQVNWTPDWDDAWKNPYQPCPSKWYEAFDRLPRTRVINATIIDYSGTSYESQKYGTGYTGRVGGE